MGGLGIPPLDAPPPTSCQRRVALEIRGADGHVTVEERGSGVLWRASLCVGAMERRLL